MFVKMFKKIHDSSIASDYMTRYVFMDLLILADRNGLIDMTNDAISRRTGVPMEVLLPAIEKLQQEDPLSNSPELDGKRIIPMSTKPYGWQIVNFEKYRDCRSVEDLKAMNREKQARFRERQRVDKVQPPDGVQELAKKALDHLNQLTGHGFKDVDANLAPICARLKETELDLPGMLMVIENKVAEWKTDPKMGRYLRPATLFRPGNYQQYYGMREAGVQAPQAPAPQKPKVHNPHFLDFEKFMDYWADVSSRYPALDPTGKDREKAGLWFEDYQDRLEGCPGLRACASDFEQWCLGSKDYINCLASYNRMKEQEKEMWERVARNREEDKAAAAKIAEWQAAHPGEDYETHRRAEQKAIWAAVRAKYESGDLTSAPTDATVTDNIVKPTAEPQ